MLTTCLTVLQVAAAAGPTALERLHPTTTTFLVLSFLLFTVGTVGVLARRNIIVIFMSIELILNAVNLNLVAFSRHWELQGHVSPYQGQVFAIFVVVVAAAEAAIGLGIVIALYRNRGTVAIDEIDLLKW